MASPGIRVGVGLEGAKSFQDDLKKMTAKCKALDAQMNELASGFDKESKSQGKNAKEREALNKLIEAQKQKAALLADQIKALEDAGEGETTQCYKLRQQLAETNQKINEYSNGQSKAAKETGISTAQIVKAGAALGAMKIAATAVVGAIKGIAKAAVNAAKGVWNLGVESGEWADSLITDSTRAGIDVETMQEWAYAARFIDTEVSTMTGGMNKLTKAYDKGTASRRKSVKLTKGLTVSLKKENGEIKSQAEFYLDVIDSLHGMSNVAKRNAAAQAIFGKSYTDMIPLIEAGSGAIRQYAQEARDMGIIISGSNVSALGDFDDQMQRFDATMSAIKTNLAVAFLPVLELVSGRLVEFMGTVSKALEDGLQPEDVDTIVDAFLGMFKFDPEGDAESASAFAFIGGLISRLKDEVVAHSDEIKEIGKKAWTALSNGVREAIGLPTKEERNADLAELYELDEMDAEEIADANWLEMWGAIHKKGDQQAQDKWSGFWKGIWNWITGNEEVAESASESGEAMAASVAEGMDSAIGEVESSADAEVGAVEERVGPSAHSKSTHWGREIGNGLAAGMEAALPRVSQAANKLAAAAAAPIHFSLPDEGPLRKIGLWGGEMIDQYVSGIKANAWKVSSAMGSSLGLPNVNPAIGGSTTNYGGVTIVVNGAAGQDVNQLADIVMMKMQSAVSRREAVFA